MDCWLVLIVYLTSSCCCLLDSQFNKSFRLITRTIVIYRLFDDCWLILIKESGFKKSFFCKLVFGPNFELLLKSFWYIDWSLSYLNYFNFIFFVIISSVNLTSLNFPIKNLTLFSKWTSFTGRLGISGMCLNY